MASSNLSIELGTLGLLLCLFLDALLYHCSTLALGFDVRSCDILLPRHARNSLPERPSQLVVAAVAAAG